MCVCFPQSLNCTFGLALNKGKLSKVTSVRGWSQRAGRKWETRVWKMANGEVLDRIVESHYSPAALLYLSHKHFEDSTQKPEPSQLQMPALLGQIRGIGGIKERIKVKKKVPGLLNVYSQDPRHEYHYQILDSISSTTQSYSLGGEKGKGGGSISAHWEPMSSVKLQQRVGGHY